MLAGSEIGAQQGFPFRDRWQEFGPATNNGSENARHLRNALGGFVGPGTAEPEHKAGFIGQHAIMGKKAIAPLLCSAGHLPGEVGRQPRNFSFVQERLTLVPPSFESSRLTTCSAG